MARTLVEVESKVVWEVALKEGCERVSSSLRTPITCKPHLSLVRAIRVLAEQGI